MICHVLVVLFFSFWGFALHFGQHNLCPFPQNLIASELVFRDIIQGKAQQ